MARGTLVAAPAAGTNTTHVLVQFETGQEMLVPSDALTLQADGSYYTPRPAATAARTQKQSRDVNQGEQVLPVIEEELEVGKRQVQRGGVRVHTSVEETPVEEQVTLRRETVNVERRPVDQLRLQFGEQ
jgi:hypothetical protein